ncbi:class I SAM-dependent methyltransferase [uncultured Helicobacter sp.]|nr:class I SAM-dependent methyltransferase [uncultured Helicobacter sp.]STP07620.1 Uncharacterized protein conserved in bacteria [Helicobacter fennelliae]
MSNTNNTNKPIVKETFFDVLLRKMRLARVLPSIRGFSEPCVLDVGCGWEARLLREIEPYIAKGVGIDFKAPNIKTPKIETLSYRFEALPNENLYDVLTLDSLDSSSSNSSSALSEATLDHKSLNSSNNLNSSISSLMLPFASFAPPPNSVLHTYLPFKDESFEIVTMLAVIEHLHYPIDMLREIARVLKPNGILLLTAPSHLAKPVLEFLSYRLHLIDENEILDHKRYYNKRDLAESINQVSNLKILQHRYFQCGMNNFLKVVKES